jgi:hypothetical protein
MIPPPSQGRLTSRLRLAWAALLSAHTLGSRPSRVPAPSTACARSQRPSSRRRTPQRRRCRCGRSACIGTCSCVSCKCRCSTSGAQCPHSNKQGVSKYKQDCRFTNRVAVLGTCRRQKQRHPHMHTSTQCVADGEYTITHDVLQLTRTAKNGTALVRVEECYTQEPWLANQWSLLLMPMSALQVLCSPARMCIRPAQMHTACLDSPFCSNTKNFRS